MFWKKKKIDDELTRIVTTQGIKIAILEKEIEIIKVKMRMKLYKLPIAEEEAEKVPKDVIDDGFNELRKLK